MSACALLVLGAVLALGASCTISRGSPDGPPPETARRDDKRAQPPATSSAAVKPAPAATATGRPPPEAARADPEAAKLFLEGIAQPPAMLSQASSPPKVTVVGLEHTARGEAGGMRADGAIIGAMLTEGQRASLAVTLAANDCATFVAQGGLGVVELDLFLTSGEGSSMRVIAEDPTSGPIAVIGGRAGCVAHGGRAPLKAELHARVRRGAGLVLVRGFRK
jgi:hypothetical protein